MEEEGLFSYFIYIPSTSITDSHRNNDHFRTIARLRMLLPLIGELVTEWLHILSVVYNTIPLNIVGIVT